MGSIFTIGQSLICTYYPIRFMMRPYLTLLKDSFHEAFVSRVLWILLGVSTLVLMGIAPLGLDELRFTRLRGNSVGDWPSLLTRIKLQSEAEQPSPGKHIWQLAGDEFHAAVNEAIPEDKPPQITREIVQTATEELNKLLANPKFFDADAWSGAAIDDSARATIADAQEKLANAESLDRADLEYLNRELLKAAYPREIVNTPDEELQVTFLGMPVGVPMPIDRRMVEPAINRILAGVMDFFVGVVGVFVAILVTATIIPQTFEPGAIDLLLSKPVSRWLLFLTKFFGGCAFILLNATYFIVILWLIIGFRFDMWNNALLLCIPVFMFLFMIYYSVSAYAAVRWKNTTVCIVVSILFWAICFGVGQTKEVLEQIVVTPNRLMDVVPTTEALVGVRQSGDFVEWRSDEWQTVLEPKRRRGPFRQPHLTVGTMFNADSKSLIYIEKPISGGRRFQFMTSGSKLVTAEWTDGNWSRKAEHSLPPGASWLSDSPEHGLICVGTKGVFKIDLSKSKPKASAIKKAFQLLMPDNEGGILQQIGSLDMAEPFSAAMHPQSGQLVTFNKGKLQRLKSGDDAKFTVAAEADISETDTSAVLAFAGESIVTVLDSGEVQIHDAASLKLQSQFRPAGRTQPYMATSNAAGSIFAVVFHDGAMALFDAAGEEVASVGSNVSTVRFDGDQLLVADQVATVTRHNTDDFEAIEEFAPEPTVAQSVLRYWVMPVYTLFPKPGRLGEVVNYVLTSQETLSHDWVGQPDPRQSRVTTDIWGTIWSSLAFIVVVLGWTCFKISRMDI